MASNVTMIKKLQHALNDRGLKILYHTQQFYSEQQQRPVTCYIVKKAVWDEKKGRNRNVELFSSFSQLQVLLFLRDMWYELNGYELPTENETWNAIRQEIKERNGKLAKESKTKQTNKTSNKNKKQPPPEKNQNSRGRKVRK